MAAVVYSDDQLIGVKAVADAGEIGPAMTAVSGDLVAIDAALNNSGRISSPRMTTSGPPRMTHVSKLAGSIERIAK
jgi:hypothetical protein